MSRMPLVQYGEGGAYPGAWYDLAHVYRVKVEYLSNHPSQITVECGATGGTPPALLSCIRVKDMNWGSGAGMFSGRIDEVKPIHQTGVGHIWQIRARDYLAALADNTVGHPMNNGCAGCMPADASNTYVPNWRMGIPGVNTGCGSGEDPSSAYNGCGRPLYAVMVALALSPRHAFAAHTPTDGIDTFSSYISPDYLHAPTKTILQTIQELADTGTWTDNSRRRRMGWDFRQGLWESPARFVVFPRGRNAWALNQNIVWAWKEHGANRVTITDYQVFDHSYDVYTRAYAMGTGDVSGLESTANVELFGQITPGDANDTYHESYNKENYWNPSEGYFRVQRDASEVRIGETTKANLTRVAQAKLQADGAAFGYTGRKMTLTTVGYPRDAYGDPPLPGYLIYVQGIPGISAQFFVVNRLTYQAPEGITTVDLGLPLNEYGLKLAALQAVARQGISGQHYVSPWWNTLSEQVGSSDYGFYHHLGVMPRNVYVQIAKINNAASCGGCHNHGYEVNSECLFKNTISTAPTMYREEDGRWVGYGVMDAHKDYIKLRWAHFMGYSASEAWNTGDQTRGWLELGWDTAFRIIVEA